MTPLTPKQLRHAKASLRRQLSAINDMKQIPDPTINPTISAVVNMLESLRDDIRSLRNEVNTFPFTREERLKRRQEWIADEYWNQLEEERNASASNN